MIYVDAVAFWTVVLAAFVAGVLLTAAYTGVKIKRPDLSKLTRFSPALVAALCLTALAFAAGPSLAQTQVPLEIPTDVIFTETNTWIETFAPIAAIGIGITVALAVLGYLGKMIAGAFKG